MKQQEVCVDSKKMGDEIGKFDEIIAEFKRQKAEFEEKERQCEAIEAGIPRELLESIAEDSDKIVATELRLKELKYEKFEYWKKLKENLSEDAFRAFTALYDMNIKDMGGIYHRAPSVRGKGISGAVSLEAVEEGGTKEENVWEFLEKVKWDILVSNPNKFVTIKEIAKILNLKFKSYATVLHLLCLPLCFSPEIKIEEQENKDHALVAYKYDPDAQVGMSVMPRQESYYAFHSVIEMLIEQDMDFLWINNRKMVYNSYIKKLTEFFRKIKYDRETETRRERDDEFDRRSDEQIESGRGNLGYWNSVIR